MPGPHQHRGRLAPGMVDSPRPLAWAAARTRSAWIGLALLPGALTVYLAFNAGGYFAGVTAAAAAVLLLVMAARVLLAGDPAAGLSPGLLVAAGALALFALWTLLSGGWSDARARALVEFDRALLYFVVLVLFGSLGAGVGRLRWMIRGVALAAVIVCAISLMTRLLPAVWPIDYESLTSRLNYPVTYWNALGLLAAIGLVLCFGMTSNERESRVVRVLSCSAMPLLASTLLLTLSRGAILAAIIGLVVFAVAGHSRALLSGLLASGPTTAIAVTFTYRADLLVSVDPLTRAARDQGETVAIAVVLCVIAAAVLRLLALRLDAVMTAVQLTGEARRRLLAAGLVAVAIGLVATAIAVDLPRQYDRFANEPNVTSADPRARLSDPSANGRIQHWRVSFGQFERTPLHGSGAGTYEFTWNQRRPTPGLVRDGHSLYLEVLGELGLVGLTLVVVAILAILVGIARRLRGPRRAMYAMVFAACVAWAIVAGIDWHWEMPVVTLWFFALGGAALARDTRGRTPRSPPFWLRGLIAGACCVLALLAPLRVAISQDRLKASLDGFLTGRCDSAGAAAHDSLQAVGSRPQPYEVMAYCALVDGKPELAVARMGEAVAHEPGNWRLQYGLARMRAMAGRDPLGRAREALRLNPLEALTRDAVKRFTGLHRPEQWRRAAQGMEILLPET